MNKLSSVIPEEELDLKNHTFNKSPFLGGILDGNKISAIGLQDITDGRKDSPFWDHDTMNDF